MDIFVIDIRASFVRPRIARSNQQRKERKVRSYVRLWDSRAQWNYALYRIGGRLPRCYMGRPRRHTRVYAHTQTCSVHARSDRTMDERYSIAVCRICSLCRDHVLVLIRAPDKIALCYRGSCLRDSKEKGRERGRKERERKKENPHCTGALLPMAFSPFCPPLHPRPYPRILLRKKDSMFCVKIREHLWK